MMHSSLTFLLCALISVSSSMSTHAFSFSLPTNVPALAGPAAPRREPKLQRLYSGVGVAETYSWKEEQFEIEVKLAVPPGTSARDVEFKCSSESIDLRLRGAEATALLDGARRTRGAICVDGTFWSIEGDRPGEDREITVTIEKNFLPESTEGGVQTFDATTDFDWGGLYFDDEGEVSHRKYDEAEEFNVREYAATLGVDIDNIDMNKVNKTMFGAGLGDSVEAGGSGDGDASEGADKGFHFNITQSTLEQLTKAGLAKDIVQQGDGTAYEMGPDGKLSDQKKFAVLGDGVSDDELRDAGIVGRGVPAMFKEQTVPVEEAPGYRQTFDAGNYAEDGIIETEIVEKEIASDRDGASDNARAARTVQDSTEHKRQRKTIVDSILEAEGLSNEKKKGPLDETSEKRRDVKGATGVEAQDPIDALTVVKLKQILRAQGLKVGGTKQVLRDRLRNHVDALLRAE